VPSSKEWQDMEILLEIPATVTTSSYVKLRDRLKLPTASRRGRDNAVISLSTTSSYRSSSPYDSTYYSYGNTRASDFFFNQA
jgi:hypothetical protein